MNRKIHKRVLETIARHSMIRPGDRVGLGVSGGADSVAMLSVLAELRDTLGVRLVVLHFNHQLRGVEADDDENFVKNLASEFALEFFSDRFDVRAEAQRNGWNLEDAARRLRYQFLDSAANLKNLDRVAVAHSMDDQAETVLAHVLRGTGLTGLAGIFPVVGRIVRPVLDIERVELREYLSDIGRTWREDATNRDTSRTRARIRHQLIPTLRRDFEESSVIRLARLASLAREDETYWRAVEEERLATLTMRECNGNISLRVADLLSPMPSLGQSLRPQESDPQSDKNPNLALTRRLVRRIVEELRGTRRQLTSDHVENVLDLAVKSQSGARIELPGIGVERVFDRLVFSAVDKTHDGMQEAKRKRSGLSELEFEYSISLSDPSKISYIVVPEIQRRFSLKVIDWHSAPRETIQYGGTLDFDRLRWPLVLRNWRPGDTYCPHGHRRNRKLKRLFLESRIPRRNRATWPVLISAGRIVWVSGFPTADEFAPHSRTRSGLAITEDNLPNP